MSKSQLRRLSGALRSMPQRADSLTIVSAMESNERPELDVGAILQLLAQGELEVEGALPWGSNYTLLSTVRANGLSGLVVYKPRRGERPLWDFTRGTLCQREVAAYLVSELLGWGLVPPTVLRDGPYGIGSVQLFIEADERQHLLTMQQSGGYQEALEQLALFDVITNNADRKSGHCLRALDGRMWAIDHGICFHTEYKLRTVLWDFAGQPIPAALLADLGRLRDALADPASVAATALGQLLAADEYKALMRRSDRLLKTGRHLEAGGGRNMPWPPI